MHFPYWEVSIERIQQLFTIEFRKNLRKFGHVHTTPAETPFEASELSSLKDVTIQTLETSSKLSLIFQECILVPEKNIYTLHGTLFNTSHPPQTVAYSLSLTDRGSALHKHDYIEIIYVYSGYITEYIEGEKYVFTEKQVCFLNRNCAHEDLREESEGIVYYFHIRPGILDNFLLKSLHASEVRDFLLDSMRQKQYSAYLRLIMTEESADYIEECIGQMVMEYLDMRDGYTQLIQVLLLRILNEMGKSKENQFISVEASSKEKLIYNVLIEFIENHLDSINVEMLCNTFHYQKDYYNRVILKHTGMTFSAYLQKRRLERAKDLLHSTELSIADISLIVGYKNPAYFFRIFKENTGVTPSQYRKQ